MQLNSSVNLFSKGEINPQNVGEETIDVTTDVQTTGKQGGSYSLNSKLQC